MRTQGEDELTRSLWAIGLVCLALMMALVAGVLR